MSKIAVIILTYNEELHIERCLINAFKVSNEVYVIDCYSEDKTKVIAESVGAKVIQRQWPGNQAEQFNWALDNIEISADWILKLDADEYLLPELIDEINLKINSLPDEVFGISFSRRLIFCSKWIKRGAYPNSFLRLFKKGFGRSEERLMDEHIVINKGDVLKLNNDFVDHNLSSLDRWLKKHVDYANREVVEHFNMKYFNNYNNVSNSKKELFNKTPLFVRSFIYFFIRYVFKGGFLEGKASFIWNFFQGLWYRLLIDTKIWMIQSRYSDKEIIHILNNKKSFDI